jgi:hypothetical protein
MTASTPALFLEKKIKRPKESGSWAILFGICLSVRICFEK